MMAFISLCTDVPPPSEKSREKSLREGAVCTQARLLSTNELLPVDTSSTDKAPNAVLSKTF